MWPTENVPDITEHTCPHGQHRTSWPQSQPQYAMQNNKSVPDNVEQYHPYVVDRTCWPQSQPHYIDASF